MIKGYVSLDTVVITGSGLRKVPSFFSGLKFTIFNSGAIKYSMSAIYVFPSQRILLFVPCKCGTRYFRSYRIPAAPWPEPEDLRGYRAVAIMRDPTERFLSAVQGSVFAPAAPGQTRDQWQDRFEELYANWQGWQGTPSERLENFTRDLLPVLSAPGADPHFATQCSSWQNAGIVQPSTLVPLRDITVWSRDNLGLPPRPATGSQPYRLPLSRGKMLTAETRRLLQQQYHQDYQLWNQSV
jgi:hypothetical protein